MTTVLYDAFLPEVTPYCRDVPEFVAINAIRNACMEFCKESLYLRLVLDPVPLTSGVAEYDLEVPLGSGVAMIIAANLGQQPLKPMQEEDLRDILGGDWRTTRGGVSYITQDSPTTVRLVCTPEGTFVDDLNMTVALTALRSSTKIDSVIYERWAEVIGFGARARLHDTPGQPYSDMEAAKKFRKWFETGYGDAKIAANRGLGRGPLVVRPLMV